MKTYHVFLTPDAVADLESIYRYIAESSGFPETALRYIQRLRESCEALSLTPQRGYKRDDIRKNLRVLALDKRTVVAFEIEESQRKVMVLGIFHGGRDYETLMAGNED